MTVQKNTGFNRVLEKTGAWAMEFSAFVGGLAVLCYESFRGLRLQGKKGFRANVDVAIKQTLFTGVEALPLVAGIAILIGIIIIIQSMTTMPKLGAGDFFGKIFVLVIIRELGPLLTAIIVIGRSGSALAAFIGNMKVNQEIEALEVMGINPIHFLVMPAMLGTLISMVCLTLFFDLVAIFGGYFFIFMGKILQISAFSFDLPLQVFLYKIIVALSTKDVFISFIKCIFFALVISIVSCYHGMNLIPSFTEVPKATRRAVVQSLVLTMVFNSAITVGFYSYGG